MQYVVCGNDETIMNKYYPYNQQLQEEASGTSVAGVDETSIFWDGVSVAVPSLSIPGRDMAIFLKSPLTLWPAFADVSINMIFSSADFAVASSCVTCRLSDKSALFPTSTMMTSFPRSDRTSSIHFVVERNDARFVISYTTIATEESRIYEGIRDRKRSCPAVSHSCSRTVRSSKYKVLLKKSIPIVAWYVLSKVSYINRVINEVFPTD